MTQPAENSLDKPHTARKAGRCSNWRAAVAGNAPECERNIGVGDQYFYGDYDPYAAGGFGRDRFCVACHEKGYM